MNGTKKAPVPINKQTTPPNQNQKRIPIKSDKGLASNNPNGVMAMAALLISDMARPCISDGNGLVLNPFLSVFIESKGIYSDRTSTKTARTMRRLEYMPHK
jgi:hypothetical protein